MAQRSSAARKEILRELERRRMAISVAKGRVVKKSSAASSTPSLISSAGTAAMKLANAPKEGAANKGSASRPYIPRVLIPTGAPGADRKIVYMDLGEAPKRLRMPRREAPNPRFATTKAPRSTEPVTLIPHAPAAATITTKLSARTEHEHKTSGAETQDHGMHKITEHGMHKIKKPSSAPVQQPHSSSSLVKKGMTVKVHMPAGTLPTGQRLVILHDAIVVSDVEDGCVEVVCKGNSGRTVRIALDQVKTIA